MTTPSPETTTRYYRTPSGSFGEINESHPGATVLPDGAVEITAQDFEQGRAAWQAGKDEHIAALQAEVDERNAVIMAELTGVGVSETVARLLLGYRGSRTPAHEETE